MEFEFDWTVLGLSLLLSGVCISMIWGISLWDSVGVKEKVIITLLFPVISYFLVSFQLNR